METEALQINNLEDIYRERNRLLILKNKQEKALNRKIEQSERKVRRIFSIGSSISNIFKSLMPRIDMIWAGISILQRIFRHKRKRKK